ncbi:MAG TPA: riboflavin kinase, partial [Aggregatilineales bacterium]|nr:riboflavin kinase [Aggregatilineales bacterium]
MNHIRELSNARLEQPSIVTIGVFDGVHRGHRYLLEGLVETARSRGMLAVVLTLFPHPDIVLRRLTGRYYLTTPEQQAQQLGSLGIDVVVTQTFDEQLRHVRAAAFVDQLRQHLQMAELWITTDFALGYQREGNFEFLSKQGREKGFEVRASDLLDINGTHQAISSSAIREALQRGDVEQAANWLGRPYRVEGTVVHGDHRGRELGFPTANVDPWSEQV